DSEKMSESLFTQLHSWESLWEAYGNAADGKRGREATAAFEYKLADNLLELQAQLAAKTYQPGPYYSFYIHEPKRRLISAAPFRDRVAHHALCALTTPCFERRFIADSYANRPGKGTHRALDRAQGFARRFAYFLPCDVVQFFPSVDHQLLNETLRAMLPDDSLDWMIERILNSGQGVLAEEYRMVYFPQDDPEASGQGLFAALRPRGLPIGNLTSQWWANCYLNPFDHFAKRQLGCRGYLRYVDDFLLFSDSKAQLWEWRAAIIERMARLRLSIHAERAYPRPVTEGIPFLGFVVYPEHRRLKRRKGLAYRRKLRGMLANAPDERLRASLRGWINHVRYADTYGLRRAVLAEFDLLAWELSDG
ncbi:MAG: RNA-directed DNA polymerase, partial [Anaerolineales bacterium]|nr:RNA-directed DNA polymerase [Anaerolineales bacterium]